MGAQQGEAVNDADKERARVLAILSAYDLANATFAYRLGKGHPEAERCRNACDLLRQLEDEIRSGATVEQVREKLAAQTR